MATRELTGRKVLLIFVCFFGVIISVNFLLAFQAVSTFPGVEARNSYQASQTFEADRAAQLALGWDVSAGIEGEEFVLRITGPDGEPVRAAELTATLGRATHVNDDRTPQFAYYNGAYRAAEELGPGNWNLRMRAVAEDGTPFRQRIVIYVR